MIFNIVITTIGAIGLIVLIIGIFVFASSYLDKGSPKDRYGLGEKLIFYGFVIVAIAYALIKTFIMGELYDFFS